MYAQPYRDYMCFSLYFSLLLSVSVGTDMMFCAEGCTAVIDTGSSYITGPASSVSVLMKTIGADLDESGVSLARAAWLPTKNIDLLKVHHHHLHHLTCFLVCFSFHQYKVNCGTVKMLPSITFHLGGQEYSLTHEDYILWVRNGAKSIYVFAIKKSL